MFITPSLLLIALAILLVAVCLPAIVSPKKWQKEIKKIISEESLLRLLALFLLLFSFLFLSLHWKLNGGWLIIIPIIGWLTLIKALTFLWFPEFIYKKTKNLFLKSEVATSIIAFVGLLMSIGLIYIGLYQF